MLNCPHVFYCKVSNMHLKDSLQPHCSHKAVHCFLQCVCRNFNCIFLQHDLLLMGMPEWQHNINISTLQEECCWWDTLVEPVIVIQDICADQATITPEILFLLAVYSILLTCFMNVRQCGQSSCKHVLEFFSLDYDILMNGVQVHYFFMMSELCMFCMLVLTHIFFPPSRSVSMISWLQQF